MNIVAIFLNVFVPWGLWILVSGLAGFRLMYFRPELAWTLIVLIMILWVGATPSALNYPGAWFQDWFNCNKRQKPISHSSHCIHHTYNPLYWIYFVISPVFCAICYGDGPNRWIKQRESFFKLSGRFLFAWHLVSENRSLQIAPAPFVRGHCTPGKPSSNISGVAPWIFSLFPGGGEGGGVVR